MSDAAIGAGALARRSEAGDFVALLKPRVMVLVVFTGIVGLWLAPGDLHPVLAAVAVLCIALGSGAAGAINMWYDRDIDAVMARTRARPIPAGRVAADDALGFGVLLAAGSVGLLGLATNWFAAGLLAAAIAFYVFVYTIGLKRRTPHNIVIGGAAGAFPPLIGWAAVTGDLAWAPVALFALIFFWTPPHFWALALFRSAEYARAGVPMLPVVAGHAATRRQILAYTVLLVPLAAVPWLIGAAGPVYAAGAVALSLVFVGHAVRLLRAPDSAGEAAARRMFGYSIFYLFATFALLLVDGGGAGAWNHVAI